MAGVKLVSCFKSVCIVIAFPGHSLPFYSKPVPHGAERLHGRILRGMERERYADGAFAESMEELAEKRMLLGVLQDAMDSSPAGRTGACHEGVRGGNERL